MELILEQYFLIATLAYMGGFFLFGKLFGSKYMNQNPIEQITKETLDEGFRTDKPWPSLGHLGGLKSLFGHRGVSGEKR